MKLIEFGRRVVTNAHTEIFFLCNGIKHYEVTIKHLDYIQEGAEDYVACVPNGWCDEGGCWRARAVTDIDGLPWRVKEVLGLEVAIAPKHLLVVVDEQSYRYKILRQGRAVSARRLSGQYYLAPGKSCEVYLPAQAIKGRRVREVQHLVENRNGEPRIRDLVREQHVARGREAFGKARALGFSKDAAYKIVHDTGPYQIDQALELAFSIFDAMKKRANGSFCSEQVIKFINNLIQHALDRAVVKEMLSHLNINIPACSGRELIRVLAGAKVANQCGLAGRKAMAA